MDKFVIELIQMRRQYDEQQIKEQGMAYFEKVKEELKDYGQFDNYLKSLQAVAEETAKDRLKQAI